MPNTFLTPKVYANTMLALLKNQLVMGKLVTTSLKDEFKSIGNTVYVKRPPEFILRTGSVANAQNIIQGEAPVTIDTQAGVDIKLTEIDAALNIDQLGKNAVMQSAAATIAQGIDQAIMNEVLEFPNWVGTPGETINSITDFFKGPERLDDMAVPQNMRNSVLSTRDYWAQAGSMTGLYQYEGEVANNALKKARLPIMGNVDAFMTQNVVNLVTGTRTTSAAAQVDGASQAVAYTAINTGANAYTQTLNLKGLTNGHTIKRGETFAIAGVFAVNPRSKATMDYLQQFVVLEDVIVSGTTAVVRIANPIITSGAYQTVSAAPADSAAVTWLGSASTGYRQNAVFHKSAISLVFVKPVMPTTGEAAYSTDPETGITIRYWQFSDGINDEHYHRWDVFCGCANADRRLGTRLSGTP